MHAAVSSIRRHTVVVEDLEGAAYKCYLLQEVLQLLYCDLLDPIIFPFVEPVSSKRRELWALRVRRVVVELSTAVGRPEVGRDTQAVDVLPANGVAWGGDPGDNIGISTAVVVQPPAYDVFVHFPRTNVELSDPGNHVGQSVGGRFVFRVGLVLIGVQLTSLEDHRVGVVIENSLGILKTFVNIYRGERLHISRSRHQRKLLG